VTNSTPNKWSIRYGAIRRAKDRQLLAELERRITAEEQAATHNTISIKRRAPIDDDARAAIAKAFGRPLR
jgi:hypothetical protein